jgi:hypothetical protein
MASRGRIGSFNTSLLKTGSIGGKVVSMSATVVREKHETTLPPDVVEAAGLKVNDQVDWRFEDGEIRGRKLAPREANPKPIKVVNKDGHWMLDEPIPRDEILAAIRADREGKR